ncbi:MAG: hypothetical protein U1E20_04265 [Methylocystis sp.]|uniref:hypothetical protein n=1 Tax=Methylocystis sp. TaxID=1911079 RepID=UPI003951A66E
MAPVAHSTFLSFRNKLYLVSSAETASRLAPYVPITLIDARGNNNPLQRVQGVADVMFTDETKALVRLCAHDIDEMIELKSDYADAPFADWLYGAFHDQWIATEAEIEVVDATLVEFELYLPERNAPGKVVSFEWEGGQISVDIPRGEIVKPPPIRPERGRRRIRISTDANEDHSNSSDLRLLGVIASVLLDESRISPWLLEGVIPLLAKRRKRTV